MKWPWQIWIERRKAQRQAVINAALLKLPEVQAAINSAYQENARRWVHHWANQPDKQARIVNLQAD